MKMKKKLLVTWVVLLLSAISIVSVDASETQVSEEDNNSIYVEISNIGSDGVLSSEILELTEEEVLNLQTAISGIMEKIEDINDIDSLRELIERFLGDNPNLSGKLTKILTGLKIVKNRAFVISSGQGIDYNPLKKISFKIRKRIGIWHYNSNAIGSSNTVIIQPLKFRVKTLHGSQIGLMSRFTGIYISFSRGFLKESNTFFIGMARHINGIQLTPKI